MGGAHYKQTSEASAEEQKLGGKGPLLSPSQGGGGAFSEKLGRELCRPSLGGGAAFQEAAADKKHQVDIFLDLIKCVT